LFQASFFLLNRAEQQIDESDDDYERYHGSKSEVSRGDQVSDLVDA
jgi:hypothetical protein